MKTKRLVLPLIILALAMSVGLAAAGTDRSPSKDTLCLKAGICYDSYGIQITGSSVPAPCSNGQVGYIGWDLSGVSAAIASAQLTLTTYSVTGALAEPVQFQLVEPVSHIWTENGTDPGFVEPLHVLATGSTILANLATPQQVVFGGAANPADAAALGAYLEGLRASGTATVGVRISAGCSTSTAIAFEDSEPVGPPPPAGEPDLILYSPTSVGLSSFSAATPAVNWPLYVGLAALAVVLAAGGAYVLRRRAGAR